MRKFRAPPSFTMASPAPAISTRATRRPVRPSCRPCAKNTRSSPGILTINPDGSLFCDSLRTNRTLDLRDRAYFKQALVANGVVTLEPVFGRLTGISVLQIAYPGARGIRRAEIHPARLVQSAANSPSITTSACRATRRSCSSTGKAWCWLRPSGKGWTEPAGASIANSDLFRFAAAPNREPFREVTGPDGRTQVWAVARSPSIRDAGLYILVGRSKDGLVAAANRRLYEDLAMLAVASLLLLAGVWVLATMSVGRQVGRLAAMATKLGLGDLSARIAAAPSARRTRRTDDAAQRHRRVARAPARRDR